MKPKYLVYILATIILAYVVKGYFCVEQMQCNLEMMRDSNSHKAVNHDEVAKSLSHFQYHLILSGVFALVIAICCRLKAPK
tara:strand:- start:1008 stop:1250 length:243 start_codon:yes stop_codon:yes gene_type:complete